MKRTNTQSASRRTKCESKLSNEIKSNNNNRRNNNNNSNGQQQQRSQASYKYGKSRKYHVKSINNTNLQPNGHWAAAPTPPRALSPPSLSSLSLAASLFLRKSNKSNRNRRNAATSTKGQIDNHNFIAAAVPPYPLSLPLLAAYGGCNSFLHYHLQLVPPVLSHCFLFSFFFFILLLLLLSVRDVSHKFEFDFEFALKRQHNSNNRHTQRQTHRQTHLHTQHLERLLR